MINALRYEPRGQRQQFEPRGWQRDETRYRHIHVNLHLHLGMRIRRFSQPTIASVTTMFAAFVGALSMVLSFFILSNAYPFVGPRIDLATNLMTIGALLGSLAVLIGGLPLLVSAWRSTPRSRNLLAAPIYILPASMLFIMYFTSLAGMYHLIPLFPNFIATILTIAFYSIPLISTIAIIRGLRQATIADRWIRFTAIPRLLVIAGMLLMIAGMLLWGGTVAFFLPSVFPHLLSLFALPYNSWLLQLIGMLVALVVAIYALFSRSDVRKRPTSRPKDASPHEYDRTEQPRGYRGEGI